MSSTLEIMKMGERIAELENDKCELLGIIQQKDELIKGMKYSLKIAYIKGIRTMANALKEYDRTYGACTDYFEHTVDKVLKNLLKE